MWKWMVSLLAGVLLSLPPSLWAGEASGRFVMEFDLSHHPAGKPVRLWIPYPVSSPEQRITGVAVRGDFSESAVYADQRFRTPILFAAWEPGASRRTLTLTFHAQRKEVVRKEFPSQEPAWNPGDYAEWLSGTSLGPVEGVVAELAHEITRGKRTVLEKARAIYDWTVDNMHRDPATRGCGKGDVCSLLARPGGKCTDIHSVFVALCRAAGVPAREIFGVRMGKGKKTDVTTWQHCWAEFFLPGYGWVPVDPADVLKAVLVRKLPLSHPEIKELREYFFGAWEPRRVELARGRDLILTPAQEGGPLNTFGYPYAEVDGIPLDWLEPKTFTYRITYFPDGQER